MKLHFRHTAKSQMLYLMLALVINAICIIVFILFLNFISAQSPDTSVEISQQVKLLVNSF